MASTGEKLMSDYEKGYVKGRDFAVKLLCEMLDKVLAGQRCNFDPKHPHSATFERLVRRLDNKLN